MNKYIEELVTEMYFDVCDVANGNSFKEIGYDSKKDFFEEMRTKLAELKFRLVKEQA